MLFMHDYNLNAIIFNRIIDVYKLVATVLDELH
jgi:hypothetical protein